MSMTQKRLRAAVCTLLALLLALTMVSFPTDVFALGLNKTSFTLTKGYSTTLKVSGTSSTVKWSSSDKTVATVSSTGKVVGKGVGTATITATVNGTSLTSKVKVVGGKLALSKKTITMDEGSTQYVTLKALGSHGLKVTPSNKSVATAAWVKPWDGDNIRLKITAKSAGTASFKISLTKYPDVYTTLKVTVEGEDATILTNSSTATAKVGASASVIVYTNKNNSLGYSFGDSTIASVSEGTWNNGTVTLTIKGLKAGNTTLKIYRKDDTSVYKNVTIAITAADAGYYTVATSYPTKSTYTDQVLNWTDPKTGYTRYMLVPSNYDSAKVNSVICKYNGTYSYYMVFDEVPTKQASTDTVKEFSANVSGSAVKRYVLVPTKYDVPSYDTAVAQYTNTYNYWTVYNCDLSNHKLLNTDLVKTWTATVNYKTVTRYILVPYLYDEAKLNNIIAQDTGTTANGYYGVSTTKPALKVSTDKILEFTAKTTSNGVTYTATYYVLVPQNYDEARYNDAVASINGYEYYTIYTTKPTKKLAVDEIIEWTKIIDSKTVSRYVLAPTGYSPAVISNLKNNDLATQTTAYYVVSTTYPSVISADDIIWSWRNPTTGVVKYMLLPANYSTLKRNDLQSADTGVYEYYHIYSTVPKVKQTDDNILRITGSTGTMYMLVPAVYDQNKVNDAWAGKDVYA